MSHEEAINEMKQYFGKNAEVGIFWYNPEDEELFEVHSLPVTTIVKEGKLTYPKLHKTIWSKLHHKTLDRQKKGLKYNPIYLEDYTQIPRGRVFFRDGAFYIFTGSWITDEIKKMIIDEFNLQKCNVVFKIDSHWELGHGWSSEKDALNFH